MYDPIDTLTTVLGNNWSTRLRQHGQRYGFLNVFLHAILIYFPWRSKTRGSLQKEKK